ncbi:MAG: gliding motility-associated C-terminal domain-containing protein [Bacteroidales bacterium]|nr:gliding motility-associated C-terminal domain-containing protein [Bacteroidales bacterium]
MKLLKPIYLLLFFTLLFSSGKMSAQDYVCISTDPVTGQITLTWSFPNNTATVDYYFLQWSLTSGNWNNTDSVGFASPSAVTTYTVPGINGNNNRYYFRIFAQNTNTTGFEIWPSNIFLTVTEINKGIAKLSWNPDWLASTGTHHLQRLDNSLWRTIYSIPNNLAHASLSYNDTLSFPYCDTTEIKYRVSFEQAFGGCSSISNIDSGEFLDTYTPSNPSGDTVSIYRDPAGPYTGCPIIGWTKSPEKDIAGYIIYREDPVFIAIDTIPSDSTVFLDKAVKGCLKSYTYALAAIDSCGKTSYGTYVLAPHNMVLDSLSIDPCERKAYLRWNAYDNMPGGLGGYIVYRQINFGSFTAVGNIAPGITNFYDSTQFINGNDYTYYIQAFSQTGAGTSSSCMKKVTYHGPVIPDTLYITQVNIANNNVVEVGYYYSPPNRIRQMVLERSDDPLGPFSPVDTLGAATGFFLPQLFQLDDPTANVNQQSYYYRLAMIDSCNKTAMYSENVSRTIFLNCTSPSTAYNLLEWNEYSTWYNGVEQYEVYRTLNGVPDPSSPLTLVTGMPFSFQDNLLSVSPTAQVCYYIRAVENPGNPVVSIAFSMSNLACVIREPLFIMPNAFNPEGTNYRFRPIQAFVDPDAFMMQIYNKWGQRIFETSDIDAGWNGMVKGILAPADVYVYYIKYRSLQGEDYEKRGTVVLIK